MKKVIMSSILIIATILMINNNICVNAQEIESSAKSMVVIDGYTNQVLYNKNAHTRLPMASTTKIITAILSIENCEDLDKPISISDKAVGIEGTSIYLKNGEQMTTRNLLYGLMLASGNDCAVALAESLGGVDVFVGRMNSFATDLGLKNTHFDNPHGLDSDTHYTSAYDLAIMTSYALNNDTFREIVATQRWEIEGSEIYPTRYLKHKNKLLFLNDNCIGVKTGFTDNAGRCLVNAHEENDMRIISVVLNCQPMFEECKRLTDKVLDEYIMKEFVKPYNFVSNIDVLDSKKTEVGVITVKGYYCPILKAEEAEYEVKYNLPDNLVAPVRLNQEVGTVSVYYNDEIIYEDTLITIEEAHNNDMKHLFDNIIDKWF